MSSARSLLLALQHGDSFFPGGGVPFSWGLETSVAEGHVTSLDDLRDFVRGQLQGRWATCDRPALVSTHRCGRSLADVASIDADLDAMALSREMRHGGRRAGGALLNVHARLGTPLADDYKAYVRGGRAPGQLAVVQGLVWRGVGLDEETASAVSAHTMCVGFVGAAVRLGLIGHIDGQVVLRESRESIDTILADPPVPFDAATATAPAAEIAMMRHEVGAVRMFAN